MSQQSLAEALELSVKAVSDWERNASEPHPGNYQRIAEKLRVNLQWLATGEGLMRPEDYVKAGVHTAERMPEEPKKSGIQKLTGAKIVVMGDDDGQYGNLTAAQRIALDTITEDILQLPDPEIPDFMRRYRKSRREDG